MPINVRKTLTDAGYVAVGLGVLGVQQAQVRRRELQERLADGGRCLTDRAADGRTRLESLQESVAAQAQTWRSTVETQARAANEWAADLGTQVKERVEPVLDQFVDQVKSVTNRAA